MVSKAMVDVAREKSASSEEERSQQQRTPDEEQMKNGNANAFPGSEEPNDQERDERPTSLIVFKSIQFRDVDVGCCGWNHPYQHEVLDEGNYPLVDETKNEQWNVLKALTDEEDEEAHSLNQYIEDGWADLLIMNEVCLDDDKESEKENQFLEALSTNKVLETSLEEQVRMVLEKNINPKRAQIVASASDVVSVDIPTAIQNPKESEGPTFAVLALTEPVPYATDVILEELEKDAARYASLGQAVYVLKEKATQKAGSDTSATIEEIFETLDAGDNSVLLDNWSGTWNSTSSGDEDPAVDPIFCIGKSFSDSISRVDSTTIQVDGDADSFSLRSLPTGLSSLDEEDERICKLHREDKNRSNSDSIDCSYDTPLHERVTSTTLESAFMKDDTAQTAGKIKGSLPTEDPQYSSKRIEENRLADTDSASKQRREVFKEKYVDRQGVGQSSKFSSIYFDDKLGKDREDDECTCTMS